MDLICSIITINFIFELIYNSICRIISIKSISSLFIIFCPDKANFLENYRFLLSKVQDKDEFMSLLIKDFLKVLFLAQFYLAYQFSTEDQNYVENQINRFFYEYLFKKHLKESFDMDTFFSTDDVYVHQRFLKASQAILKKSMIIIILSLWKKIKKKTQFCKIILFLKLN